MTNQQMNQELFDLYVDWAPKFYSTIKARARERYISHPHLIEVSAHYAMQKIRVMIVGQQARDWRGQLEHPLTAKDVRDLMKFYSQFQLGKYEKRSVFWQGVRRLAQRLYPKASIKGFVWTNLIKFDGGDAPPPWDLVQAYFQNLAILAREIEILQPNAVVFFTGPNYDDAIRSIFKGVQFQPVLHGVPPRDFAQVIHPQLPEKSYRLYHPVRLRLTGMWHHIDEVAQLI